MADHSYYDSLRARPDCYWAYNMRSDVQLVQYANVHHAPYYVTFDPVMDAARVVLPPDRRDDGGVLRPNSLGNQVRFPIGTQDGFTYIWVWDARWTATYANLPFQHKAFQLTSGSRDGNALWFEAKALYGQPGTPFIATHEYRSYNQPNTTPIWTLTDGNQVGPGTVVNPFGPQTRPSIRVDCWTRFVVRLQQRAQDWDVVDAWMLDEVSGPFRVVDTRLISVRPTGPIPYTVKEWWCEFNSSTDATFGRTWDLISYVRNLIVLKDIGLVDLTPILQRPGAQPPPPRPLPPTDLRFHA